MSSWNKMVDKHISTSRTQGNGEYGSRESWFDTTVNDEITAPIAYQESREDSCIPSHLKYDVVSGERSRGKINEDRSLPVDHSNLY